MPKHLHADLMMQYAQDAMETDTPWKLWEGKLASRAKDEWVSLGDHPAWVEDSQYRRKTKTININGYEVPEPLRVMPEVGDIVYCVSLNSNSFYERFIWENCGFDKDRFKRGLVYKTKNEAQLHTHALLSFTKEKE